MSTIQAIVRGASAGLTFFASAACAQQPPNRSGLAQPSTAITGDSIASAHQFVQQFYDWYAAIADTARRQPVWPVLSNRSQFLEADLAAALRGDSIGRVSEKGSREVLDFDPFFGSSNPCKHYEVTDVTGQGGVFKASVRSVCVYAGGERGKVVVDLIANRAHWKISNVIYPQGGDLKYWLCKYAKEDTRTERRLMKCG